MTGEEKEIRREYTRLWRLAFPEKATAIGRRCDAKPERKARQKEWRHTSSKWKQTHKRYCQSDKGRAAYSRYFASPKGRVNVMLKNHMRRARIFGCEIRPSCRPVYERCQELRQWFDVVVDHIIPLSRGGAHAPENLQIIYRKENEQKGRRLDYKPKVVFK